MIEPNTCVELYCGVTPCGSYDYQYGKDMFGRVYYRWGHAHADRWRGGWQKMSARVAIAGIRVQIGWARVRLPGGRYL